LQGMRVSGVRALREAFASALGRRHIAPQEIRQ
jgi:hypothetical protein